MKKLLAFLAALFVASQPGNAWAASPVSVYDFQGNGVTSTSLGGGHRGLDISGTITTTNASVGPTGSPVPASAIYVGADSAGNLAGLLVGQQTMANSLACVLPSNQSAIPVSQSGAWNTAISAASLPLPTGAATSALQTTGNTALTTINTTLGSPFQAGGSIGNTSFGISGTLPAFAAIPTFKIDQTTPGTTNGVQVNAALPAGSNIIGKVSIDQTTPGTTNGVQVNAALPAGTNTIGSVKLTDGTNTAAVKAASTAPAATDPAEVVAISPNSTAPKTYPNSAGSFVLNSSQTTTPTSETCPAGGVGFILEASSSNGQNLRWALGATASTTSGMRLEPGRDTVFVPVCATISIVAESGTQEYELTWVKQ